MAETKRIVVIGGGPGGYVAAIRAAQLGGQVTLIEKEAMGGTCVNRGCVPTKFLIQATGILQQVQQAKTFGISVGNVSVDFPEMMRQKQMAVVRLRSGIEYLMSKNKIKVFNGTGTLISPDKVKVKGKEETLVEADRIIIATGSVPVRPPINGVEDSGAITSDEILNLKGIPASLIIIGGGVIGIEFAQIFQRLKSKVSIVEMMPHILPSEDADIARILGDELNRNGIDIYRGARVNKVLAHNQGKKIVEFDTHEGKRQVEAECVLIAAGRKPYTEDSGIDSLGITLGKNNKISVNQYLETDINGIYAIGDVLGGSMLAHVAMAEGICAAENALGMHQEMAYRVVPRCVYSSPEVACVGLNESEAKSKYGNLKVGIFPLAANSRAKILHETSGFIKIIAESDYNQVLGVEIIGPQATELIAEAALALKMEATLEEITSTIHAHPTLSEAFVEAALNGDGRGINY